MFAQGTNKLQKLYEYAYEGAMGQKYTPALSVSNLPSLIKKGSRDDIKKIMEKFPESLNKPLIDSTDYREKGELTPLQIAIKYQQGDIIKWLISEFEKHSIPLESDQLNKMLPCFMDDIPMIKSLLTKGATLSFPLLMEAIKQDKTDLLILINEKNQELFNQKEPRTDTTPLHQAAISGQLRSVQFILRHFPNQLRSIEKKTSYTPLHETLVQGHKAVGEFLLSQYGSDELMKISPSILNTAIKSGKGEIVVLILEKLPGLKENFYKNFPDEILDAVQSSGNVKIVTAILDTG